MHSAEHLVSKSNHLLCRVNDLRHDAQLTPAGLHEFQAEYHKWASTRARAVEALIKANDLH